jgi:HSP20 family molecular chaperone IbpA
MIQNIFLPANSARLVMPPNFASFFNMVNEVQRGVERVWWNRLSSYFDVTEDETCYYLEGELPGIDPKSITIEFSDDYHLTIHGRTEHKREVGQQPSGGRVPQKRKSTAKISDNKQVAPIGSEEYTQPTPRRTYWFSERSIGEFSRSFSFTNSLDQHNVKAILENSVLSVVLPKLAHGKLTKRVRFE